MRNEAQLEFFPLGNDRNVNVVNIPTDAGRIEGQHALHTSVDVPHTRLTGAGEVDDTVHLFINEAVPLCSYAGPALRCRDQEVGVVLRPPPMAAVGCDKKKTISIL